MTNTNLLPLLLKLLLLFSTSAVKPVTCNRTYIVYMNPDHKPSVYQTNAHWYEAHLHSLSIDPTSHLVYAYSSAVHGYAAFLLPHHVPLVRRSPAVHHLHPDPLLPLHTTRSPQFLHLPPFPPSSSSSITDAASAVIIGVLDTGVWPESRSFDDSGLPAVPSRWRGACEPGVDFDPSLCNRKLIGARSFSRGYRASSSAAVTHEYDSARDRDGHGTHTASTTAGSPVGNASLFGYAPGTARGMAAAARIAVYKVCWATGCLGSDILAGIDRAISDGVDILSLSLGGGSVPYFRDTIAVGAFSAVERGIFVACSAGNGGPGKATLTNSAPWIATVGAGTLDRDFPAYIKLSSGERYTGVSLYSGRGMGPKMVPIVYGENNTSKLCLAGTLDSSHVRGKVVFCDRGVTARVEKGAVVKAAGGVGMVLANTAENGEELVADSHLLPTVAVGKRVGDLIREYVGSHPDPKVVLSFGGTVVGLRPSPLVAAFSSRGPNVVASEILKPDFIGPGVNILAGWSGAVGPTGLAKDDRRTEFNIMSGTSMSCPHISGVAALLKAAHPEWSTSAIKSALMTTAYTRDNTHSHLRDAAAAAPPANPFSYGAGHVNPLRALSPGLIYETTTEDYLAFLCSLGYSIEHVQAITKRPNITCKDRISDPGELNYPSYSVIFRRKSRSVVKYSREVTNVGPAGSVYDVRVGGPESVGVTVKPERLEFKQVGQKLKYSVTFVSKRGGEDRPAATGVAFGWITWKNKQHSVRSPIAYSWKKML